MSDWCWVPGKIGLQRVDAETCRGGALADLIAGKLEKIASELRGGRGDVRLHLRNHMREQYYCGEFVGVEREGRTIRVDGHVGRTRVDIRLDEP